MKYCSHCGEEIMDEAVVCVKCGCAVGQNGYSAGAQPQYQTQFQPNIIETLSEKIKLNGMIWAVVAALQFIIGLATIVTGYGVALLIVAALNAFSAYSDFKYSKEILTRPTGIIDKYEPVGGLVINLVYNILFGGLIGVAGTVYGFILRNYVVANKQQILAVQQEFIDVNY